MLHKNTLKYLYQDLDELIRQYSTNQIDRFSFVSEVERLKQANEIILDGNEDFAELVENALLEKEYEILEQMASTALENAKAPSSAIRVLILTGAGISAESGVRTFRDSDGLWEEYDVMEVCSVEGFERNPKLVADFYDARRRDLESKLPNAAHDMVARLKRKYPTQMMSSPKTSMTCLSVPDVRMSSICTEHLPIYDVKNANVYLKSGTKANSA